MTPALIFTILGFAFTALVQVAIFAYFYGRLTMKIEVLEHTATTLATKTEVNALEEDIDKLAKLFERFLTDIDTKLDKVRTINERDDVKIMRAIEHVEQRMESAFQWIGERLELFGKFAETQGRYNRKIQKATGVELDSVQRMSAVTVDGRSSSIPGGSGDVTDPGRHRAVVPSVGGIMGRKIPDRGDPRTE